MNRDRIVDKLIEISYQGDMGEGTVRLNEAIREIDKLYNIKKLVVKVPNEYANINQEAFNEWMEYKKYKNKGAITKTLNMLNRHDYQTQQDMVDKSIMNEYKGLFEPKVKRSRTDNNVQVANSWLKENDFLDPKYLSGDC